jgi:predicted O-methyltransferase YrrM
VSSRTLGLSDELNAYLVDHGVREHPVLTQLREQTTRLPEGDMQIAPEEGALLGLLVRLIGARRVLEVGTFTGYSSTAMALSLPPDGTIVCCDVSQEWTDVAQRAWAAAGVADRVDLRLGPAAETLNALLAAGETGRFDLAFIDADKEGYPIYYDRALELVRPGGLIALDNVLRDGRVIGAGEVDPATQAIRDINDLIAADERVDVAMVPIADGLTLARIR